MNKRRSFLTGFASLTTATVFSQTHISTINTPLIKRIGTVLKPGDRIKLIAPGFAIDQTKLAIAIEGVRQMGFEVVYDSTILNHHGYFSNTDEFRAKELNEAFEDESIDAIICARGGYGCTRLLDMINYHSIEKFPKALIGFSDITALLNAIYLKTGLVGFHGPVGSTLNNSFSLQTLQATLTNEGKGLLIENASILLETDQLKSEFNRYTITEGIASGTAIGGNLSVLVSLLGTAYEPDFSDKILFLEDVGEKPYRIDRMLTQILSVKSAKKLAGIVLGVFNGCDMEPSLMGFTLKEVVLDRIKPLNIPALYGMSFGHIAENFTFPIGAKVALDATNQKIKILENTLS